MLPRKNEQSQSDRGDVVRRKGDNVDTQKQGADKGQNKGNNKHEKTVVQKTANKPAGTPVHRKNGALHGEAIAKHELQGNGKEKADANKAPNGECRKQSPEQGKGCAENGNATTMEQSTMRHGSVQLGNCSGNGGAIVAGNGVHGVLLLCLIID